MRESQFLDNCDVEKGFSVEPAIIPTRGLSYHFSSATISDLSPHHSEVITARMLLKILIIVSQLFFVVVAARLSDFIAISRFLCTAKKR